ncbi:hypothetical protein ASPZODRAFT_115568 [Penicilliopsis zonata CBS 506.65]|uniref:Uncharacterized protein n=1 Tax=Penicilliopsis zonata CBS 506.65 TaxID=1073090 RepID=A0A1L9SI23_9EURO|nr:hypothetical protein ASPZODRAFT_115568 [Penicilliopsis zonata CBS 506.65]OJJ46872.1 hypothetical protein ASPZODRAFT_115568 [Penicilliopsis zonata CBS 506.65]
MNSYLLNRTLGSIPPSTFHVAQTSRLVQLLEPAPGIRFVSRPATGASPPEDQNIHQNTLDDGDGIAAHQAGVKVLAIDQFEGRYMVSGGADPSIHLWDLESRGSDLHHVHRSIASVTKASHREAHTHAITSVSIYPFDPTPSTILTTSHDRTLKLSALEPTCITPVHTFSFDFTPYSHSFSSHPASSLLIAVGTSEKTVRLLDLRSGLATHALPGHSSGVLSVSWAPHRPHILASGSTDHQVIMFDVRRAGRNAAIATLDMDDPTGVVPVSGPGRSPFAPHARAHTGAVTGVRWTSSGSHLITAGQDARIRVWDAATGANTLVHFGPRVRNSVSSHLAERAPLVLPGGIMATGHETLLWPNFHEHDDRGEIFVFEMREGTFVKRLKVPGLLARRNLGQGRVSALSAGRINALAWRGNGASGEGLELFSAHGDGTIRAWVSRDEIDDEENEENEEEVDRKRKREVLEELYRMNST